MTCHCRPRYRPCLYHFGLLSPANKKAVKKQLGIRTKGNA
jgi:hypothetical protein